MRRARQGNKLVVKRNVSNLVVLLCCRNKVINLETIKIQVASFVGFARYLYALYIPYFIRKSSSRVECGNDSKIVEVLM